MKLFRTTFGLRALIVVVGLCALLFSALRASRNSRPPYLYAEWLGRENEARRLHAAQELGEQVSDLEFVIAALDTALLTDSAPSVRKRSAQSLDRLFLMQPKAKALSGPAVNALLQALADERPEVRATAAAALGRICPGPATAVPALLRAARDEDARVRGEAVAALGLIEGAAAVDRVEVRPVIAAAMNDADANVREKGVYAFLAVGAASPKFAAALLKDRDVETRRSTVAALIRWGDVASLVRPELTQALTDPDEAVRTGAARALTGTDVIPLNSPVPDDSEAPAEDSATSP